MPRKTEFLLCGDNSTLSPTFGEFSHTDFEDGTEDGATENVDAHIVRLYRKRFRNVTFNRRELSVSFDVEDDDVYRDRIVEVIPEGAVYTAEDLGNASGKELDALGERFAVQRQ